MSQETRLVPVQVTSALTNEKTATLAPVALDEVSTKIVAAIDLIASLIPDLRTPHPSTEKKVRGGGRFRARRFLRSSRWWSRRA